MNSTHERDTCVDHIYTHEFPIQVYGENKDEIIQSQSPIQTGLALRRPSQSTVMFEDYLDDIINSIPAYMTASKTQT